MWKYSIVKLQFNPYGFDESVLSNQLTDFGKLGWELVSMEWFDTFNCQETKLVVCTFKQPLNI